MRVRPPTTVVFAALASAAVLAQAPSQSIAFDAASVKPVTAGITNRGFGLILPGNRLEATNASLRDLVAFAYGSAGSPGGPAVQQLLNEQVEGDQGWLSSDRFNVTATGDVPPGRSGAVQKSADVADVVGGALQAGDSPRNADRADLRIGPRSQ